MDVSAIRQTLAQGNTKAALQALNALLETDKKRYKNLLPSVRAASQRFHAIQQQEHLTLSFADAQLEYGKVNTALGHVLDALEEGRFGADDPHYASTRRRILVVGLSIGAVLIALLVVRLAGRKNTDAFWQQTCKTHTLAAYRDFLAAFPDSPHAYAARDSLISTQKNLADRLKTAEANIIAQEREEALKALDAARRLDPANPEITRLTSLLSQTPEQ